MRTRHRRLDEPGERAQRGGAVAETGAEPLDRIERGPAGQHRQIPEEPTAIVVEQLVGPGQGRPQGFVSASGGAVVASREVEALIDPLHEVIEPGSTPS